MNLVKTSYPESDVTILLQDVRGKVPVLDTAERESDLKENMRHYVDIVKSAFDIEEVKICPNRALYENLSRKPRNSFF